MYLSTSTNSQVGASFTPNLVEPVESYSETNIKAFIVQSPSILYPRYSHTFECNLYLKEIIYLMK